MGLVGGREEKGGKWRKVERWVNYHSLISLRVSNGSCSPNQTTPGRRSPVLHSGQCGSSAAEGVGASAVGSGADGVASVLVDAERRVSVGDVMARLGWNGSAKLLRSMYADLKLMSSWKWRKEIVTGEVVRVRGLGERLESLQQSKHFMSKRVPCNNFNCSRG